MSILSRHIGHSLTVISDGLVRCEPCSHTLDLRTVTTTSTSPSPPNTREPRCPRHFDTPPCRGCAADDKQSRERTTPGPNPQAAETTQRGVALARAILQSSKKEDSA